MVSRSARTPTVVGCALLGTFACLSRASLAQVINIDPLDRGWYNSAGAKSTNSNFIVGWSGSETRNYFIYNIPALQPGTYYSSALLQIRMGTPSSSPFGANAGIYDSVDATEIWNLYDVNTSLSALMGGIGGVAAFNDLGTGQELMAFQVGSFLNNGGLWNFNPNVPNSPFVQAVNSLAGGTFAFGGRISTISGTGTQTLFSFSNITGATGVIRLQLTMSASAPEPGVLLLLGCGLPLVGGIARRRLTASLSPASDE